MRLVVTEFVTVDGVMEDPGGAEGFEHGGWSMRFFDEEIAKFKLDELLATDALLLGRVTYEGFAAAWPSRTDEAGFADRMNSLPKFVVSTTLDQADWNNSTLIKGNVAEEVSKLKEQPGQDLVVHGAVQPASEIAGSYVIVALPVAVALSEAGSADADGLQASVDDKNIVTQAVAQLFGHQTTYIALVRNEALADAFDQVGGEQNRRLARGFAAAASRARDYIPRAYIDRAGILDADRDLKDLIYDSRFGRDRFGRDLDAIAHFVRADAARNKAAWLVLDLIALSVALVMLTLADAIENRLRYLVLLGGVGLLVAAVLGAALIGILFQLQAGV